MLGKANMDEFAMGSSNENSGYGPVLNPWDSGRVPGGSSGGSAAAVAGRLAPCAIGTDTGGSIRQPAALCGIVGMKPTYGAVSRYGMIAFASSLDQCGPLARNVTDATLILQAVEGRDPCDSTSVGIEGGVALPSREYLKGLSFGIPKELASDAEGIESGVKEVFERTVALIEELGGEVSETELPHAPHGISAYYVLAPAEASANLARFDGVRYGMRVDADDLTEMYEETRAEGFGAEVKRRIMLGTYALSSGYYEAYYGRAQRVRTKIAEDFSKAFESFDFVVTPTSPTVAFKLGAKTDDPLAMYMNDYCTVPMPLAGIPAISIPAGSGATGRRRARAPGRIPDRGPGLQRLRDAGRGPRAGGSDRLPAQWSGRVRYATPMTDEEFRQAVQEALDSLPPEIADRLTNVAMIVEDSHPSGRLLGLFDPRGGLQRIIIYREHHTDAESVKTTVLHEIGHYFGADEATVRGWGL